MENKFPSLGSMKWKLWLLSLFKIPMIAYCRPRLLQFDETFAVVRIRRRRSTKNHLNSIYFGALMVGADVCAGLHAFAYSIKRNQKIAFAFKSCKGDFLKRAESDVYFVNSHGKLIETLIEQAEITGERQHMSVPIDVFDSTHEKVAVITMELSVKILSQK